MTSLDEGYELAALLNSPAIEADQDQLARHGGDSFTSRLYLQRYNFKRIVPTLKRPFRLTLLVTASVALAITLYSIVLAIFYPLYTSLPPHYKALNKYINHYSQNGRGNLHNQKVFIAANIVNADMIDGPWGDSIKELIELLGPQNSFLSIYENDSGERTSEALNNLRDDIACNNSIVTGAHLDLNELKQINLPEGKQGVKRIEYLAEVRNRALRPLEQPSTLQATDNGLQYTDTMFDYVLFINDVYFDPVEALQLLFLTNSGTYEAACAIDFVSITNYYDSYASRDYDGFGLGYGPGFRIFPWFSSSGSAKSRKKVLAGSDAVPVRACWGGMVSFKAKWFQARKSEEAAATMQSPPLRFRADEELFWDSSECCLIHADISSRYKELNPDATDHGIFVNPFVRVAYEPTTFRWLKVVTRFEHGFSVLQHILTWMSKYPLSSERRKEVVGEIVQHQEWVYESDSRRSFDTGSYIQTNSTARKGGFCGKREMAIMKDDFAAANSEGKKNYDVMKAPWKARGEST